MNTVSIDQLQARAQAGDASAQVALSRHLDQAGRHGEALELLRRAAEAGDVSAMTFLGVRLISARAAPWNPDQGGRWLARAGSGAGATGEMARLGALMHAAGAGVPQDLAAAVSGLSRAAEAGDPDARVQLGLLTSDAGSARRLARGEPLSKAQLDRAVEAIDITTLAGVPEPEEIFAAPCIQVFRGFVGPGVCARLRGMAAARLKATQVHGADNEGDRSLDIRTSSGAGFSLLDSDVILSLLRARMARAANLPLSSFEPTNILRYEPGQEYRPHFDYFNVEIPHFARIAQEKGQRVATFLIYLNDDYDGGETAFPQLDWKFKAKAGDGLLFFSLDKDGAPDPMTLHAGLPPTRGEKWLLSQWIRDKPQPII